jgi:hypothetical protein
LPTGAENISFQRGFGTSLDSFIPATEFIQTGTGWADTVPLRPGSGSLNLLVSYELPYDDGLMLAHPLLYPVASASAIMANAGVAITDESWVSQGTQSAGSGSFVSYVNTELADADALNLTLDGRPTQITDAEGNTLPVRNQTTELIVGGVALAAMLAVGFFLVQRWRTGPVGPTGSMTISQPPAVAPPRKPGPSSNDDKTALLQTIAALDEVYEAGEIEEEAYQQQRRELKSHLTSIWR